VVASSHGRGEILPQPWKDLVNGVNYKIRRGVEVEVPPEVAEVLEHSQQQDEYTAARIAAAETAAQ